MSGTRYNGMMRYGESFETGVLPNEMINDADQPTELMEPAYCDYYYYSLAIRRGWLLKWKWGASEIT